MSDLANAAPMARAILESMKDRPTMDQVGIEASRAVASSRTTAPAFEEVRNVEEHVLGIGDAQFSLRLYIPETNSVPRPLLLYTHAGGWILGDLEHSDHLCRRLCNRSGAVVVNVGYRLSPEHKFPAPLDDCEQALQWSIGQADRLGVDERRIALVGESSGGNLAAALALRLSRDSDIAIAYLLLLEPALDAGMQTPSWSEMGDLYVPARSQMSWMWENYLRGAADIENPEANPSVATEFVGHPVTAILTAGFDPLRDEGKFYAAKLEAAGVPVTYRCEEALMHAFCNLGGAIPEGLAAFDRAVDEMMDADVMRTVE